MVHACWFILKYYIFFLILPFLQACDKLLKYTTFKLLHGVHKLLLNTYYKSLPMLLMIFLTCVWLKRPLDNIQSATTEMNIENSHMQRYGRADKKPFC